MNVETLGSYAALLLGRVSPGEPLTSALKITGLFKQHPKVIHCVDVPSIRGPFKKLTSTRHITGFLQ